VSSFQTNQNILNKAKAAGGLSNHVSKALKFTAHGERQQQ